MTWSGSPYSVRFPLPELLEVGKDTTVTCSVYDGAELATMTAATVTLYTPAGVVVVGPTVASIVDGVPTAVVTAASLSGQTRGDGYRISWLVTIGGEVYEFDNECSLVRRRLPPVVTDQDLYARVSALNPASAAPITSRTTFRPEREEAWVCVQSRLLAKGRRPHLVLTPAALREVHLTTTLAIIFENESGRNADRAADKAMEYRAQSVAAWADLRLVYDEKDDDGSASSSTRQPTVTSIWLGSGR